MTIDYCMTKQNYAHNISILSDIMMLAYLLISQDYHVPYMV